MEANNVKRDTVDDIIAQMREIADNPECVATTGLRHMADRLEAAAKRESVTCHGFGNAAALREALVKIYHEIRSYCHDYGAGESHESLVERILDDPPDYTSYKESILEIDRVVETALAEPPRNCDRPECATLEKATNTWIQEEVSKCDSKATMADIRTFDVWMYAPATEQKGEK